MRKWRLAWSGPLAIVWLALAGCAGDPPKLGYFGDAELQYYKEAATDIDFPAVESETAGHVMTTEKPHSVQDRQGGEIRDLALAEAMQIAMQNNAIIRSTAQFLTPGNSLLSGPDRVPSIYDPAIQESGVLFGGRGLESALSAFDPRWTTTMLWGRNEQVQNNAFFSGGLQPGTTLTRETGTFDTRLQKFFANGGQFAVTHNWDYLGVNTPGQLFPSAYTGAVGAEYRLPILAGAGTEYTRIAGPIAQSFGGLTGVNQGVVIARINNDLTLADFELAVRNLLKDVEDAYWELYLQYRLYDTAVTARNSTLEIWRLLKIQLDLGGKGPTTITDEVQARAQYFETRAASDVALGSIYRAELQLRRLLGLPSNDGQILRPCDEPPLADFVPDWDISLVEALTQRTELRRQKFNIKSLELQMQAANSLTRPRLDFVSGYRVNGFGDKLLSQSDDDGRSPQGLNSAYETITQGNQTGWTLGLEMTMDLGFRSANAQVRNIELRLAKARDVLAAQELEISHELSAAFQDLGTNYATAQANFNRSRAEEERVELFRDRIEIEDKDLILRAQLSRALAEAAFYRNMADYARSVAAFHYAKGDLLEYNNVQLAESLWTPKAYDQALRRAIARSHALNNRFLDTEPGEFVYPGGQEEIQVLPSDASAVPALEQFPGELKSMDPPALLPSADPSSLPSPPAPASAPPALNAPARKIPALRAPASDKPTDQATTFRYPTAEEVWDKTPWPQRKPDGGAPVVNRWSQIQQTLQAKQAPGPSKSPSSKNQSSIQPAFAETTSAERAAPPKSLELDPELDLLQ